MDLTKYGDILDLSKKRCNVYGITDFDDIISTGINAAYLELKKKNPLIETASVTSADMVLVLPTDCMDIIKISPDLYADEHRLGDNIILQRDETFSITYSKVPDTLINTTDIPVLNKKYWYALSTYGCYAYYNYKKKHNEASTYLQEYFSQVDKAEPNDELQHQVQNVYSSVLNGVDVWQGF